MKSQCRPMKVNVPTFSILFTLTKFYHHQILPLPYQTLPCRPTKSQHRPTKVLKIIKDGFIDEFGAMLESRKCRGSVRIFGISGSLSDIKMLNVTFSFLLLPYSILLSLVIPFTKRLLIHNLYCLLTLFLI